MQKNFTTYISNKSQSCSTLKIGEQFEEDSFTWLQLYKQNAGNTKKTHKILSFHSRKKKKKDQAPLLC